MDIFMDIYRSLIIYIYTFMDIYRSLNTFLIQRFITKNGTYHQYINLLKYVKPETKILDIGCGDGIYFTNPLVIQIIKENKLLIHCIDIDYGAINILKRRITKYKLNNYVSCECINLFKIKKKYDYHFYVESYPVIPNDLFKNMIDFSKHNAKREILLYHNLVNKRSIIRSFCKENLKYILNIDFGSETTICEQKKMLKNINKKFSLQSIRKSKLFGDQYLIIIEL